METLAFQKQDRLLKRHEFQKVMQNGRKRRVENLCTVLYLPNPLPRSRLGIIASRKVGNAVIRNRAKRRVREIFRCHRTAPGLDIVIICSRNVLDPPFSILERKLANALDSLR